MTKIQIRRDTSSNWQQYNPTPSAGEPCYETDTGKFKIGNGTTPYNSLDYIGAGDLPDNITTQGNTFNGAGQLVQLDSTGKLPAIDGSQLTNIPSSTPSNMVTTDTQQDITATKNFKFLNILGPGTPTINWKYNNRLKPMIGISGLGGYTGGISVGNQESSLVLQASDWDQLVFKPNNKIVRGLVVTNTEGEPQHLKDTLLWLKNDVGIQTLICYADTDRLNGYNQQGIVMTEGLTVQGLNNDTQAMNIGYLTSNGFANLPTSGNCICLSAGGEYAVVDGKEIGINLNTAGKLLTVNKPVDNVDHIYEVVDSGNLQNYLVAGTNVTLTPDTDGKITINSTGGGGGSEPPANMVTTDTAQTITGSKTFDNGIKTNSIINTNNGYSYLTYNPQDLDVTVGVGLNSTLTLSGKVVIDRTNSYTLNITGKVFTVTADYEDIDIIEYDSRSKVLKIGNVDTIVKNGNDETFLTTADNGTVANLAMPNVSGFTDKTLPATGTSTTTTEAGYLYINKVGVNVGEYISVTVKDTSGNVVYADDKYAVVANQALKLTVPIPNGCQYTVDYTATGDTNTYRFIKTVGQNT